MLACTALVGCTNEDVIDNPANEKENQANAEAIDAYVSVKLVMTESTGSRAATDGGYDVGENGTTNGTVSEQSINPATSVFLFYDNEGQWVTSGQLMALGNTENHDGTHHGNTTSNEDGATTTTYDINDIHGQAYIVLSGPDQELQKSEQVLTIVNYNTTAIATIKEKKPTLKEVLSMIANDPAANSGFLMTTSVYYKSTTDGTTTNTLVQTTEIDAASNIKSTQAEAKQSPVEIYIERASAKVQLTTNGTAITTTTDAMEVVGDEDEDKNTNIGDESGNVEGADIVLDGEQKPVKIIINGWTVNNVNTETYLVKQDWSANMPTAWNNLTTWNNSSDHRSYWAVGTKWNYEGSPTTQNDADHVLTAYSYDYATQLSNNLTNSAMYCYEQTVGTSNVNSARTADVEYPNATTVLIAAQIALPVTGDNGEITGYSAPTEDLFKYGGVFYKESQLKTAMMNLLDNYVVRTVTTSDVYTKNTDASYHAVTGDITIGDVIYKKSTTPEVTTVDRNLTESEVTYALASDGSLAGITCNSFAWNFASEFVWGTGATVDETPVADNVAQVESFKISIPVTSLVKLANNNTVTIIKDGDTDILTTEAATILTMFQGCDYVTETVGYDEGKCYYQIPIEHLYSQNDANKTNLYGVVRNHWYKLDITGVKHIGEPVYDPTKSISTIPAKSTDYYLAARLHVLSWHVVNQGVVLE